MKNCETCANKGNGKKSCRTMIKPFDDYSCWGDVEMVKKREGEIKAYYRKMEGKYK